ncbi:MAG: outer membrane protein assembly factor BamD [Opitutae bacterium]|nr:outer membrane protein assembly factor BamD [Opitutae bacterium]
MRLSPFPVLLALAAFVFVAAPHARADIVWAPGTGWRVEGGVLATLSGEDGRNALDLMNKARAAEEAHSARSAIKLYQKVAKRYPNSIYAAESLYRVGLLYQGRKEYYKAFDSYQDLLAKYPGTEKFNQVVAEQYRIASQMLEGARPYVWGLFPGFKNRERSVEYFEKIIANAPYSDYAPLSLMNVARGQQKLGATEEAIDALDRMINTYPRSVLTPDAYLKIAQTHASLVTGPYYDQGSTKEAITYFEDYLILFPGDSGAAQAEKGLADMKRVLANSKLIIADYYFKYRKNYKAAKVFYNEAITVFPDSDVAAKAKTKLATVDALLEKQPQAVPVQSPKPGEPKKKKRFWLF